MIKSVRTITTTVATCPATAIASHAVPHHGRGRSDLLIERPFDPECYRMCEQDEPGEDRREQRSPCEECQPQSRGGQQHGPVDADTEPGRIASETISRTVANAIGMRNGEPDRPGEEHASGMLSCSLHSGKETLIDPVRPGLPRRRSDDRQPVHPARPALRLRPRGRPLFRSGLPLLVGMAATFALVATLAAVGGGWAVANPYGRGVALALIALLGLTLIFPDGPRDCCGLSWRSAGAFARCGRHRRDRESSVASSLVLGGATGLLWAPCAGPMLGLILTGAALNGPACKPGRCSSPLRPVSATSLALALFAADACLRR